MIARVLDEARGVKAYIDGPPRRRRWMRREKLLDFVQHVASPLVAVDVDGIRYVLDAADRSEITMWTWVFGAYEEPLMRRALRCLAEEAGRPDALRARTFVDVGANIGTASLVALLRHGAARGVAIEPHPANVRLLKVNLAANDLDDRVAVVRAAASDVPGELALEHAAENIGDHRIRPQANGNGNGVHPGLLHEEERPTLSVRGVPLDDALAEAGVAPEDVGLTWVDVQGFEAGVLRGADGLLAAGGPVLIEYWPYGLDRTGGLDLLHRLVAERFSRAWELGTDRGDDDPIALRPDAVAGLAERYAAPEASTNLLLLP